LDYFKQTDGKYISRKVPGMPGGSPVIRVILMIVPIVALAVVYLQTGPKERDFQTIMPFIAIGSVFALSFIFSLFLRKRGFSSGIVVDQMQGKITYRRPGASRQTVPISATREIGVQLSGSGTYPGSGKPQGLSALYLILEDGRKLPMLYSRKGYELRRFADELSVITSLSVREGSMTDSGPGY
jgi:hypothetical protein